METTQKIFNLIVLDESGSMDSIKNQIISGFNELIQTIRGTADALPNQKHLMTMVTFNGLGMKTLFENEDVHKLKPLTTQSYRPNSSTPLYDALGDSILRLKKVSDLIPESRVLVTVLTDGAENASREYSGQDIQNLIKKLSSRNWTFTYIGTEHDVEHSAVTIAITNVMKFQASEEGISAMFVKERSARSRYYNNMNTCNENKKGYYDDGEAAPTNQPAGADAAEKTN